MRSRADKACSPLVPARARKVRRRIASGWALLACALAVVLGCSSITVRRVGTPNLLEDWSASSVEVDGLSPRTLQTLRQCDLEDAYRRSSADAYARLQVLAARDPQPDRLFALAEMSYLLGREAEKWGHSRALVLYYLCAGYAYHYLFPEAQTPPPGAAVPPSDPGRLAVDVATFDPRFRLACDLYNAGLAKCIRAAQRVGRLDPGRELHLPTPDGAGFTLSVVHHGFPWPPQEFGPLLFSADYQVEGLANQYHRYGLGVPLIGSRTAPAVDQAGAFYPRRVNFPVTAFFRFDGRVADLGGERSGRLELYNPLAVQAVEVQGRTIPLEADLTTPLAYFLAEAKLEDLGFEGFLLADKVQKRAGIYMLEPYQPGKIPVVMVHGLLSSPLTWAPLFNDLRADPELREHFQFWFYLYPTANPPLATAADLRQALTQLRATLDPQHRDAALDQMVFAGHSMGGLVSRLLTVDSGDDFWRLVSPEPLAQLKVRPETRAELQRIFYFERQPGIRRVIFLATPHHGSKLSPWPPARLAEHFIRLPRRLVQATQDVVQENPGTRVNPGGASFATSLDFLAPGAPALELLAARGRPEGVAYHSIIGVLPASVWSLDVLLPGHNSPGGTDGVVPYSSAHLDGVDSELVVPADHTHVHQHPLAVQEVRRLLLQHLNAASPLALGARPRAGRIVP